MTNLAGVFPVISTPFTDTDEIDVEVLQREVNWLIDTEVDGLTIAMVSEAVSYTHLTLPTIYSV